MAKNLRWLSMYDHNDDTNRRKQKTELKTETGRNFQVD